MGNRDKRSREKKKPKKKEVKLTSTPSRLFKEYKPAPTTPAPTAAPPTGQSEPGKP